MSFFENHKKMPPASCSTSPLALSIFVGKTAMTPCMTVQRVFRGPYYIRLTFPPGSPIDVLHLARGDSEPTSGAIDLGSKMGIATVSAWFWDHVRLAPLPFNVCIEYDPNTGAIIEVYEC